MDPENLQAKFEVRSFIRSWDNKWYFKTLGSSWIRPRSLLSLCSDGPCECTCQMWSP